MIILKKRILLIALSLILIFSACTRIEDEPDGGEVEVTTEDPIDVSKGGDPVTVDLKDKSYAVTPLLKDSAGVDVNSALQLDSKKEIDEDFITANMSIEPATDFEIEKISGNKFKIIPDKPLSRNSIYKVGLNDSEEASDYTWAFQTKSQLRVIGTVPGDDHDHIPLETGIEVNFSHEGIENFEESFQIYPEVEGKFTTNGNIEIFVPEKLEESTKYTVTVKAGAKLKDSDLALEEDYTFSFTTREVQSSRLRLNKNFANFTSLQVPFLEGYVGESFKNEEISISLYSFDSGENFLSDIKKFDEVRNIKYLYEDFENTKPDYLTQVSSFNTTPIEVEQGYSSFDILQFPEEMDEGYYLAEASLKGTKKYTFIQISDILVYNAELEDSQFLWLNDADTGEALAGADVSFEGGFEGTVGSDGIAQIDYTPKEESRITYGTVSADGYNDFVLRTEYTYRPFYYNVYSPDSKDYWSYFFTDRSTYQPTDKVNIFGYVKPKKDMDSNNYTLSFISNVYGEKEIQSKSVSIDKVGTFTSSFSFEDLTTGWYNLVLTNDGKTVMEKEIYIREYTKPIYRLESDFNKDYVMVGEDITYSLRSEFYDGSPAANMNFNLDFNLYGLGNNTLQTDENGTGEITITPSDNTTSWRPTSGRIAAYNKDAEDQRITDLSTFTFFPKTKMITTDLNSELETPVITVNINEIDLQKYINSENKDIEDMKGAPLNEEVNLKVVETYYERVERGSYYDLIDKVTKTKYEYVQRSKQRENFNINTVNGKYELEVPYIKDSESTFEVIVTLNDGEKSIVERRSFRFNQRDLFNMDNNSLSIEIEDTEDYRFKEDENFTYYLKRGSQEGRKEEVEEDKLLVMIMQDGVKEYYITDRVSGELNFKNSYIPNMFIQGVYIDNGDIFKTLSATHLSYEYEEKEMNISLTPDKKDYRPGEVATINIKALDNKGEPVQSNVNISVVDEAYFELFPQDVNPLADLYSPVYSTGIRKDYISNDYNSFDYSVAAEKGGDGGDYTVRREFKDTAYFRTITLDQSGEGALSFKLPDNLTSWRVTFQGFTEDMQSYSSKINVNAKLPFYVNTIISKEFITGDIPSISLRVFGEEITEGQSIAYKVDLVNNTTGEEKSFSKEGTARAYTNISLEELDKGTYTITVYADGGEYKDAVEKTFEVVDSTVYFNNKEYYQLSEGTTFDEVYSNAEVTFFNESESMFYNTLMNLRYAGGKRIDQRLTPVIARKFIKENFDENAPIDKFVDLSDYEKTSQGGGISLLPYSDRDAELTAKVAMLDTEYFDKDLMKTYFYNILGRDNSTLEEVVSAYLGLAVYKEPVLLDLQKLAQSSDIEGKPRAKLLASIGLAEFGDESLAEDLFKDVMEEYSKEEDGKIYFDVEDTTGKTSKELTGLALAASAKLEYFKQGDKMFDYLYNSEDVWTLVNFEKLIYLMNRNIMETEDIKALEGSVTVKFTHPETRFETYEIDGFKTKSITLTKEELAGMEITEVESSIGVYVYGLANADALEKNKTEEYSISKTYTLDGEEVDTFSQGDLIKVTLDPKINNRKDYSSYEITEFVPAGFRFMKLGKDTYLAEESGQTLVFRWSFSPKGVNQPLSYYIQAVLPGEYTDDHTVIRKTTDSSSLWYTDQIRLKVVD